MKYKILAVDDDQTNLLATRMLLEEFGYEVDTATSGQEALSLLKNAYAVALIDYRMPEMSGAELALEIQKRNPALIKLMYSCDDSRAALKHSLRAGVTDFIDKDSDPKILKETLSIACRKFHQSAEVESPSVDFEESRALLLSVGMIGQSPLMADVARKCILYRGNDSVLSIFGETGVGKELVAFAAHGGPKRTFHAFNCATFSGGDVTEGELFGYEKGTFTGATSRKAGIFEMAGTGTVFLDEVDKLPARTQGALLRAIRERKVRRKGGDVEMDIHCRIIAAAKPNLRELTERNEFLADLYYRLNFLTIEIPPLRKRTEDIAPLVEYFCEKYHKKNGVRHTVTSRVLDVLLAYAWPGNVGELEGCMSKLLVNARVESIDLNDLDERFNELLNVPKQIVETVAELEKKYDFELRQLVRSALRESPSQRKAAVRLGVNESSLRAIIAKDRGIV